MLQTVLCKYCQGSIKDSDRFCYYCGKLVNDSVQTSDADQAPNTPPPADMDKAATINESVPPPFAATAGSETVSHSDTVPMDGVPAATIPLSASPPAQTPPAKTDMPPAQPNQPVFDSFQLQAAPSPEQIPPVEQADSSIPSSRISVAPKASERAVSALPDHASATAAPEPQSPNHEANPATKPVAGISAPNADLSQTQTDTLWQQTEPPPAIAPASRNTLQNKQKDKSKTVKPTKTVTRLKADPLAKTRMQAKAKTKTKASKPKAEKMRLPFYFLLPHMCTLFSILMLLVTAVSFYGFSSSMGVFFLFPCWPLGLLLFAALMFFTPLRDPQAPRGVNFFIKLNLAYNIFMLIVSSSIILKGDQYITVWLFVWFAGGFILPLSIMFLNRRFMHYAH